MPYRANLFDFGAVAGLAGGENAAANDAAFAAAIASQTKNIEIEPGIFEVSQSVLVNAHAKALLGVDGGDAFGSFGEGTILKWCGPAGGTVIDIVSTDGADLIAPKVSGVEIDGGGLAGVGVKARTTRRMRLDGIHVLNMAPTSMGLYFAPKPAGHADVGSNLLGLFEGLSANMGASGIGFMIDELSGATINNPVATHENGIAYFLRKCDTLSFVNASASRLAGGTGITVLFDGAQSTYVVGNRFFGLHCGAHPIGAPVTIYTRGAKARQNRIYGLDGVDNQPTMVIADAITELFFDYQGGGYSGTLAGEQPLDRVPKQVARSW